MADIIAVSAAYRLAQDQNSLLRQVRAVRTDLRAARGLQPGAPRPENDVGLRAAASQVGPERPDVPA